MMRLLLLTFLVGTLAALNADGWRAQTIYQVLTDRIIIGREPHCTSLSHYCGGTYKDLIALLPHLIDLGFTAVYISPFVQNTENGYHGYWAKNIYKVNENFGSEQDLRNFIREAHNNRIYVMVDVVFNHVGYVPEGKNFDGIVPFNQATHYHEWCEKTQSDYDTNNQINIEQCRLAGLPDLNTEN